MDALKEQLIPSISSRGGACLTMQNWQEAGVEIIACSLASLLFNPGIDVLENVSSLKSWLGWDGLLVLNTTMPVNPDQNGYKLRSPRDGSVLLLSLERLDALIKQLAVNEVILSDTLFQEEDLPAEHGFQALVYTQDGMLDLKEKHYETQHIRIDENCSCTICNQDFTRAYLHHLYFHTPLLAQRLLIMHNVNWYIKNIEKAQGDLRARYFSI